MCGKHCQLGSSVNVVDTNNKTIQDSFLYNVLVGSFVPLELLLQ